MPINPEQRRAFQIFTRDEVGQVEFVKPYENWPRTFVLRADFENTERYPHMLARFVPVNGGWIPLGRLDRRTRNLFPEGTQTYVARGNINQVLPL